MRHLFGVAAEEDVCAATRHVGGDGDGSFAPGLGDDLGFAFVVLGVQDVVAKSLGTSNPYNMVRATFDGLKRMESPRTIAAKRGMKVGELTTRRTDGASAPDAIEA